MGVPIIINNLQMFVPKMRESGHETTGTKGKKFSHSESGAVRLLFSHSSLMCLQFVKKNAFSEQQR